MIGKDTVTAMQSGVYWGYVGLIEGLVARIKAEYGKPMTVVGNGRARQSVLRPDPGHRPFDPDLTIRGLIQIHARNAERAKAKADGRMSAHRDDELVFLPLGGSGEIGMNFNAYGFGPPDDRKWIVVDCGVLFGRETDTPGVDLIMPDIRFLAEQRENVLGIVATHAHEDHIGAIAALWPMLRCPIYATPFTARADRRQAGRSGAARPACIVKRVPLGGKLDARSVRASSSSRSPIPSRSPTRSPSARRWASSCIPATGRSIPTR